MWLGNARPPSSPTRQMLGNKAYETNRAPKRILVVEDDADTAASLALVLTDEGYEVSLAFRGEEAMTKARAMSPDLVLMDVTLPGLNGFDVAQRLAEDHRTTNAAILFVSGTDDLAMRVRQCRLGEVDFLQKPYGLEELLARVECSLRGHERMEALNREAHVDGLTGLGNLRMLEERMAMEATRLQRYGTALTVIVGDVDGLKKINDRHGHTAGSATLKAIGQALAGEIRSTDVAVRYGGDEFVLLLPHTDLTDGVALAGRLLDRVRRLHPNDVQASMSLGVATFDRRFDRSVQLLLERADRAAYRAKRCGGNRLCTDDPGSLALPLVS
jgi:two-component system, cell cycle response regulator